MRTMLVVCLAVACASCATSSVSHFEAKPVPAERVLAPDLLVERADAGKVTVIRDRDGAGPACSRQLLLNRRPIALLNAGERLDIYVSPGEYILGTRPTGACSGGLIEKTLVIAARERKGFRIHADQSISAEIFATPR